MEHSGTFPLPESQMDRFMLKVSIGYPARDAERKILRSGSQKEELAGIAPLFSPDEILRIQAGIEQNVQVSEKILDYMLNLAEKTRAHPSFVAGISTRGAMSLLRLARTLAWMRGREYVIPEDIKAMAGDVLLHRLQLRQGLESAKKEILDALFSELPVPA
jgi:MoxR-like ATPase